MEIDERRVEDLNDQIFEHYNGFDLREIDKLAASCEGAITEIFEVADVNQKSVTLIDFLQDFEYPRVVFPPAIRALLEPGDTFLATLGFQRGQWHVLLLSPRSEVLDTGDEGTEFEDDCELCRAEGLLLH
jgi:hypothetical protein